MKARYEEKRRVAKNPRSDLHSLPGCLWTWLQHIFRSRSSGAWLVTRHQRKSEPVSYDDDVDRKGLASYTELGNEFLPSLSADRACTILTIVPTVKTGVGTAKAVAAALGMNLVAPRLPGLITFDRSTSTRKARNGGPQHFLNEAGPQIRKCLEPIAAIAWSDMRGVSAVDD